MRKAGVTPSFLCFCTLLIIILNNRAMNKVEKRKGYKLLVYSWKSSQPDVLTFYYMTEREMIDWVEEKLSDPLSSVTSIEMEEFYF